MAFCLNFDQLKAGTTNVTGVAGGGQPYVPLAVVQAAKTGDQYSCAAGTYLIFSVEEANALVLTNQTSDPELVADMQVIFYAFVIVLVIVFGLKQLLNLFTGDTTKD